MNALSEFMVDDLLFYLTGALERAESIENDWPSRCGMVEGAIEHAVIRLGGLKLLQEKQAEKQEKRA